MGDHYIIFSIKVYTMLGIDEFTIQLVLDDIGGSNISKETIKTFERFLRCVHRFDEDVLNLGDIKIQNEEDIICVNFKNDSSYFRITQGRIEFYRIFIRSFVITEEDDDIECFLVGNPRADGHTIISTKQHYKDMMDIPDDLCNKIFVFASHCKNLKELLQEFFKFVGARLFTMVVEVGGVWLLYSVIGQNELLAKIETQIIVLIVNYLISRFIVFNSKKKHY